MIEQQELDFLNSDNSNKNVDLRNLLYIHLSWCIWHEGVRIFDDTYPGQMRDIHTIRQECVRKQDHNKEAAEMINHASNNLLKKLLFNTVNNVEQEHKLTINFEWVAYHENRRDAFLSYLRDRNFNSIRSTYEAEQSHNPNAHYLLRCVSNYQIEKLINQL